MKKRVLVPPALRPQPRVRGKRGAPFGNRNAWKHGKFTRERRTLYADIREHIRRSRVLIAAVVGSPLLHPPLEGRDRDNGRGSKNRSKAEIFRRGVASEASALTRAPLPEIC